MKKRLRAERTLPWLAFAAAFGFSLVFYALYGQHNLNSDISNELILARLLNSEGNFTTLTKNWLYSTELRFVSPVPLYQLGFLLFGSWRAAHVFAVGGILLLVGLSALFMAREIGFGENAPWLAAMLMLPFSGVYGYIVLYGGSYSIHTVFAFLIVALCARFARKGLRGGKPSLAALAALSLVGGLEGIRLITMLLLPMAGAGFLVGLGETMRGSSLRESSHTAAFRLAAAAFAALLISGVGYVLNVEVLARNFTFIDYSQQNIGKINFASYLNQLREMLLDIGLRDGSPLYIPLMSIKGVAGMTMLAYAGLMFVLVVRLILRWQALEASQRLYLLTGVFSVALGMTLVIALEMLWSRYYLIGSIMLVTMPFLAWQTEPCRNARVRTAGFAALVCFFFFQTAVCFHSDYTLGKVNYEMAADWLVENGCTQGYATFWNAGPITEASDGQIEFWVIPDEKTITDRAGKITGWMTGGDCASLRTLSLSGLLQERRHFTEDPQGPVFLLLDGYEQEQLEPILGDAHLAGENVGWSYAVHIFESVDELRACLGLEN